MDRCSRAVFRWYLRCVSCCLLALGRLFYKLEIQGLEYLPSKGPAIIVARHSSYVDPILGALILSKIKEIHGLSAAPVNSYFMAWISRKFGARPLLKEKGLTAGPLMELYKVLQQGKIVGTADNEVSWDGRIRLPRPGAAWLALRCHAPVVVAVFNGAYGISPRWAPRPRLKNLRAKLTIRVGKPFYLSEAPCDRVTKEMLEEANQRIQGELQRLSDPTRSIPEGID